MHLSTNIQEMKTAKKNYEESETPVQLLIDMFSLTSQFPPCCEMIRIRNNIFLSDVLEFYMCCKINI